MKTRTFAALGILAAILLTPVTQGRDTEWWATFNLKEYASGPFSTMTHTHFRTHDDGFLRYYRVSQKFSYRVDPVWVLGLHPVLEQSRRSTSAPWRDTYRLDFEANPSFSLGATRVKMRNRFEVRWIEGQGSDTANRLRHQSELSWKTPWLPGVSRIAVRDEVFYDFEAERINANWLNPLVIEFDLGERFSASAGYLIASSYQASTDRWIHTDVIEFSGTFSF